MTSRVTPSPHPSSEPPSVTRRSEDARTELLTGAIARLGAVTREFNAHGTYPFKTRGLGRAPMNVLYALSRADGAGVADLARALSVTSGAISQTVDALRAAGLVTSEVNPDDRRGRIIRLTPDARDEVADFQQRFFDMASPRFDALSTADIAELDRLLALIRTGADTP